MKISAALWVVKLGKDFTFFLRTQKGNGSSLYSLSDYTTVPGMNAPPRHRALCQKLHTNKEASCHQGRLTIPSTTESQQLTRSHGEKVIVQW